MNNYQIKNKVIKVFTVVLVFISIDAKAIDGTMSKNIINSYFSLIPIKDMSSTFEKKMPGLEIEYTRLVRQVIGIGGYGGYGILPIYIIDKGDNWVSFTSKGQSNFISFGASCNIHLLPLLIKKRNKRLDIYLASKVGSIILNSIEQPEIFPKYGRYLDLSLMLGSNIYLNDRLGLSLQLGYRNFEYNNGLNIKYGIAYKF
ncbi:MAG TPA: hypothetical protein PLS94_09860 [Prolixibacteraceae bacterium]|jgi:hypothetical protein|nr:hypothetical protein [Prolixibacteraceae bacterium]